MTDIEYIQRTKRFYEAQGFEQPYQWSQFEDIPFTAPRKPVTEARIAIVTTAIHPDDANTVMIGREARAIPIDDVPQRFFTDDLSWDKATTHTDDRESYFPLVHLQALAEEGRIADIAPRYHFVPTEYSQRFTIDADAPAVTAACIQDEVDVAILVPL